MLGRDWKIFQCPDQKQKKIRARIHEIEQRKIKENKSQFFEKVNIIDKMSIYTDEEQKEYINYISIRNEGVFISTEGTVIERWGMMDNFMQTN